MQIGVSSYSFSRLMRSGGMTILDVIAKTKEMGFDTIEFSGLPVPEGQTIEAVARQVKEACDQAGFRIANYTIGADFLRGSGGDLDAEIARLKREVDVARLLDAAGMRHDATGGFPPSYTGPKSFDHALPILIKGCRAVTEYAASFGIRTMVENHGYFCQDSERVEKLMAGVAHPNFGALIDMGNFICVDEDPRVAMGRLLPYVFHVHAKDFHLKPGDAPNPGTGWNLSRGGNFWRGAIIGHGDVPLVACLRAMRRVGYQGVLSIEFEGMEDPLTGIPIGLANLRRLVADVYGPAA